MYKFLTFNGVNVVDTPIHELGKYLRIENETKYGIEVWNDTEIIEVVLPFSTKTIENERLYLKTNKEIKSNETRVYEFVSIQTSMIPVLKGRLSKVVV